MKTISTLKKHAFSFAALCFFFFSNFSAFSQCGPVAEDFNTSANTTAGFYGSFDYANPSGISGYLQKDKVVAGSVYTIYTPTYQLLANASQLGYGFTLSGTEIAGTADVYVHYISRITGEDDPISLGTIRLSYPNGSATVCQGTGLSNGPLLGFQAGDRYRFEFRLTATTGNGTSGRTITFDDFHTNGTNAQIPLPVDFVDFTGIKTSAGNQLSWKVGTEVNVKSYDVERSANGNQFFEIGTVPANGSKTYTFTDVQPASGTTYYRIKNVDNDGKYKYSTVLYIRNSASGLLLKAFPIPAHNQLTIQHPAIAAGATIVISTADGRVIRSLLPATGSIQTQVDLSDVVPGLYVIRFDNGNSQIETIKVVKQ